MGITDRIGKMMGASFDALAAPIGFVGDIASAPFVDDEVDGIINTVTNSAGKRFGQGIEGTLGKDSIVGYAAREANKKVLEPTVDALDAVYREAISRPLSSAFTAAALGEADAGQKGNIGLGGLKGLTDWDNWREGYRQSHFTSPGQAAAGLFLTSDITDPEEQRRVAGTDAYKIMSGTTDALSRIFLDPTVIGGKAAKVYKGGRWIITEGGQRVWASREIKDVAERNQFLGSSAYEKFAADTLGKSAPEIRDQYFKKDIFGSQISAALADAKDIDDHRLMTEALMGGSEAKALLRERSDALANQLDRALGQDDYIAKRAGTLFENSDDVDEVARLKGEIDELYNKTEQTEVGLAAASVEGQALITRMPEATRTNKLGQRISQNEIFQKSPLGVIVKKGTTWKPGGTAGVVALHDPNTEREFARFMQQGDFSEDVIMEMRDKYMRAASETEKSAIWADAEAQAVKNIVEKHVDDAGNQIFTVEEVEGFVQTARAGRKNLNNLVNGKGRMHDGEGRSRIRFRDPDGSHVVDIPLMNSQNENVHLVTDLKEIKDQLGKVAAFKREHPHIANITRDANQFFEGYQRYWKAGTLLRLGWPQRVIADEQMRIIAKIGALAQGKNLATATGHLISDKLRKVDDELRIPGRREWKYNELPMPSAFGGGPGDAKNIFVGLNLARGVFDKLFGGSQKKYLESLYNEKIDGDFKVSQYTSFVARDDPAQHAAAWMHDVNNQIGQDELARKFLAGSTVDEAVSWMKGTQEGRAYTSRNSIRRRNPKQWAADLEDQVSRYTMNDDTIKALALNRKVTVADLERVAPDPMQRPVVHGAILEQSMGKGALATLDKAIQTGYKYLGEKPSAFLSRNPYFDYVYRNQMKRMVDLHDGDSLSPADLEKMADVARQRALGETRDLLYDLAEQSELEEMLKFFAPFYGAWQEVITRWAGLAVENPVFVARARLVWNSPEKAGIVVDEKGNQVFDDGSALTPDGQPTKAGKDRYINMSLPSWVKDIPGLGGLETKDSFQFNKKSLNLVLNGPPGLGPLVQVPVNEIAKRRPELEKSVKFILPFGATQNSLDLLIPGNVKKIYEASQGDEDRKFTNQALRIYYDKITDYERGLRSEKPTWKEAEDEATKLSHLRVFSGFTMPFAASYVSPYQPYIDSLRGARERLAKWEKDGRQGPPPLGADEDGQPIQADEWFYDTYGKEYFALTVSMSKSMDGVPPTVEGFRARGRYQELIEKYPEFGGLIIGREGAGEFMSSVYAAQLQTKLSDTGSDMQRESPSFDESQASYEAKQGWMEYTRFMDMLEAERINRGLPHLNGKKAADLADMKRQMVSKLEEKYPGWREQYNNVNMNAIEDRMKALTEIASDERLKNREEIQRLGEYLELRKSFVNELNQRKASGRGSTLDSNLDLKEMWDESVGDLVEGNLAFSSLYYRYLDRDQLQASGDVKAGKKAGRFGS